MRQMVFFLIIVFATAFLLLDSSICAQEETQMLDEQQQEAQAPGAEEAEVAAPKIEVASKEKVHQLEEDSLVSLDFEDAEIRDVIKVLALASGMNMVIGENVQAKVTISLKDMHWEKALDVILRTYSFTYKKEENLIRIMTFEKVKQEERDIPLITKIIYLNFADVGDLKGSLSKMLSDRGSIEIDTRTNGMLITDVPAKVEEVEKVAKKLDTRTPQVLIEAMLVDVKLTKDDELGINWKILSTHGLGDRQDVADYIEQPASPMSAISSAALKIGWTQRLGEYGIDGLIQAWAQDAKANILASPKIVTLDNETATIEITSNVPYTETTTTQEGSVATTQFKSVVTGLTVKPHITKEGFIDMEIRPQQEFVEAYVNGEPQIGSRSAQTHVLVEDGETIVIGGLRKIEDTATITKIPILGDIPLLGHLFRKKDLQKINTELVMFVTPRIIVHSTLSDEEIDKYEMLDGAREDFLERMEKEKEQRLKKSRRQALLLERTFEQEMALPKTESQEPILSPLAKEEKRLKMKQKPANADYIYSW